MKKRSKPGGLATTKRKKPGKPAQAPRARSSSRPLDKTALLTRSRTFCMMPWIHLHVWPNKDVFSCWATDHPLGSLKQGTLLDNWNSDAMKTLRKNMLRGKSSPQCERCYAQEKHGGGSLRELANTGFGRKHWPKVTRTLPDGTVKKMRIIYLDFRFSNLCNFKCRSCGPHLSSSWYKDHKALNPEAQVPDRVLHAFEQESLLDELATLLDDVEEIYFAGGEPLIMDEHFRVLELLLKRKMTHVRLKYSTNFSKLNYRGVNVLKLWKRFKNVKVWASLDAAGARGEYLRKGLRWSEVVANRKLMMKECPRVEFAVQAVVSAMNALHLPDFHRDWIEKKLIKPDAFHLNPAFEPNYYRLQVLPPPLKREVRSRYVEHAWYLRSTFGGKTARVEQEFLSAVKFMEAEDGSAALPGFQKVTRQLDEIRRENFRSVFPELETLMPYEPPSVEVTGEKSK